MRIYGLYSGKNNIPKFLARSYMFNYKNKKKENKEKEKTFLQKKSFEEYNGIDWFCYIMFIIGVIIIALTTFD